MFARLFPYWPWQVLALPVLGMVLHFSLKKPVRCAAFCMDLAVGKLGIWWEPVQRRTYAAAAVTLLHRASLHDWNGWPPAAVHFAPLAALTLYWLWWTYLRVRPLRIA